MIFKLIIAHFFDPNNLLGFSLTLRTALVVPLFFFLLYLYIDLNVIDQIKCDMYFVYIFFYVYNNISLIAFSIR